MTKFINWDKVIENAKHKSDWVNAKIRDKLTRNKLDKQPITKRAGLAFKDIKKSIKDNYDKAALRINENVTTYANNTSLLKEGAKGATLLKNIWSKPWARRSLYGIGASALVNMLSRKVEMFTSEPVIPTRYEQGYDVLNDNLTDFGSPVKLLKTASKTITPYYSSVRKGLVTTTDACINKNTSLLLSKNAIKHNRY